MVSKLDIGLRQGRALCQMKHAERLDFIAEGLPLILESARGFWTASERLHDRPREADALEGHAEEEAAKILILLDIVRNREVPTKAVSGQNRNNDKVVLRSSRAIDLCEGDLMEGHARNTASRIRGSYPTSPLCRGRIRRIHHAKLGNIR
jgi:hypothetical protein